MADEDAAVVVDITEEVVRAAAINPVGHTLVDGGQLASLAEPGVVGGVGHIGRVGLVSLLD